MSISGLTERVSGSDDRDQTAFPVTGPGQPGGARRGKEEGDRAALRRLLPGAEVWWNCRAWTSVPVILNAEVLDKLAGQVGWGISSAGRPRGTNAGAQTILIARVDDFEQTGTIRIVDCFGPVVESWPVGRAGLPLGLRWYGRNVPRILYAGQWLWKTDAPAAKAVQSLDGHFRRLVRNTEGAGVPAAVLIQCALERTVCPSRFAGRPSLKLALRLEAHVWQAGKRGPACMQVEIDCNNTGSLRGLLASAP